eukprot:356003-Chlamydomonas_euryale.AAC.6
MDGMVRGAYVGAGRHSVALGEEVGHLLAHEQVAARVRVRAHAALEASQDLARAASEAAVAGSQKGKAMWMTETARVGGEGRWGASVIAPLVYGLVRDASYVPAGKHVRAHRRCAAPPGHARTCECLHGTSAWSNAFTACPHFLVHAHHPQPTPPLRTVRSRLWGRVAPRPGGRAGMARRTAQQPAHGGGGATRRVTTRAGGREQGARCA